MMAVRIGGTRLPWRSVAVADPVRCLALLQGLRQIRRTHKICLPSVRHDARVKIGANVRLRLDASVQGPST